MSPFFPLGVLNARDFAAYDALLSASLVGGCVLQLSLSPGYL